MREEQPQGARGGEGGARAPGVLTPFACGCESKLGPSRQGVRCPLSCSAFGASIASPGPCEDSAALGVLVSPLEDNGWLDSGTSYPRERGCVGRGCPQPSFARSEFAAPPPAGCGGTGGEAVPGPLSRPSLPGTPTLRARPTELPRGLLGRERTPSHLSAVGICAQRDIQIHTYFQGLHSQSQVWTHSTCQTFDLC